LTVAASVKAVSGKRVGREYLKLRQGAKQREPITFTTRVGKVDTALDPAVEEMKVGGWRRVDLREECAGVLHEAIPNLAAGEFIYMEFQLRAVQTRKSPREGGLPGAGSSGR
jgi:hypothetical protein